MPETDPIRCKGCGRPVRALVYVIVEGQDDAGPYGRTCARKVITGYLKQSIEAVRRYSRA